MNVIGKYFYSLLHSGSFLMEKYFYKAHKFSKSLNIFDSFIKK